MPRELKIKVNERLWTVAATPDTPLLYVLSNELLLQGPRFGCGLAQCGSCSVLVDGVETRACVTPVATIEGKSVTTLEGLAVWYAKQNGLPKPPALHPVQQALIDEQALQCGYCYNGMIIKAAELLSKVPQPTETQIRSCDEWPPVPLRDVPANHEGDPARLADDVGGEQMSPVCGTTAFPRRDLLKAGGVLIIGCILGDVSSAQVEVDAVAFAAGPDQPDLKRLDTWIAIHADNTATIFIGFVELGQGCSTALLQIAAEELDLDMRQVKSVRLDTNLTPNQGATAASASISRGGPRIRAAAAEARLTLLTLASKKLKTPVERLYGVERNRVGRRQPETVGHLRRTGG